MSLITTSRHPNELTRILAKDLALLLPNSYRLNRGKSSLAELYSKSMALDKPLLIIIEGGKASSKLVRVIRINHYGKRTDEIRFTLDNFKRKKDIYTKHIPIKPNYYFFVEDNIPAKKINEIENFRSYLGVKRIKKDELSKNEGVVIYFGIKNKNIFLSFYICPGMVEVGPRLSIRKIIYGVTL